jgi:hypothetical protein
MSHPFRNIQFPMLLGPSHPNPPASSQPKEPESALEALGQVVLKDDQNLIIWRQDSEAMLLAGNALQTLWRAEASAVAVEHFTGQQRLALLSHINQGIAQLGLTQAMQTPSPASLPRQISIITHAEQLSTSDVQMLQDLTRHLPGLRWHWVLLGLDPSGGLNSAAISGMNPSAPNPQWKVEPLPLASVPLATEAGSSPASKQPSNRLAWLSLAALLGLGAWGTAFHFSDPNSVNFEADKRSEATTPAASAPSLDTPPSQPIDLVASAVPAEPAAMPQASAAADTRNDVPAIALRGVRWLALQSPEFFVLEHGAFQTAAQAQSLIQTRNELANARVLMRKSASPVGRFVVVTGPFRSQERAQNYKARENLPPQFRVRKISDVLAESVRTAPSGS